MSIVKKRLSKMPKTKLQSQLRKRRIRICKATAFPVPIATVTGISASGNWLYYTATLQNDSVTVNHSGDMDFLYKMGFFGKGEMSRGKPHWSEYWQTITLPWQQDRIRKLQHILHARVTSRRWYMTHLRWHLLSTGNEADFEKLQKDFQQVLGKQKQELTYTSDIEGNKSLTNMAVALAASTDSDKEELDLQHCFESMAADGKVKTPVYSDWDQQKSDFDFWGLSDGLKHDTPLKGADEACTSSLKTPFKIFWKSASLIGSETEGINNPLNQTSKSRSSAESNQSNGGICASTNHITAGMNQPIAGQSCSLSLNKDTPLNIQCDLKHTAAGKSGTEEVTFSTDDDDSRAERQTVSHNVTTIPTTQFEWSEFSNITENILALDEGILFVIPDSDDEDSLPNEQQISLKRKWKPVVKSDPFQIREDLQLSLEEAYFLSYGMGCLSVLESSQTSLNLHWLWKEFCQKQLSFLPNYIAYHYYRSKNWVPKTGLKFGCTFLLYKDGPPFYHGFYSVVVKFIDIKGKPVEGYEDEQFSWTSLAGLKRVTEHVGKELMFCYVIKPSNMSREEMLSPSCITRFCVQAVDSFMYHGSTLSCSMNINVECNKASAAFGRLCENVWERRGINMTTKLKVYLAVVLTTFLYASETWIVYSRHAKQLNHFHLNCLRRIRWQDKISDTEVLRCTFLAYICSCRKPRPNEQDMLFACSAHAYQSNFCTVNRIRASSK